MHASGFNIEGDVLIESMMFTRLALEWGLLIIPWVFLPEAPRPPPRGHARR